LSGTLLAPINIHGVTLNMYAKIHVGLHAKKPFDLIQIFNISANFSLFFYILHLIVHNNYWHWAAVDTTISGFITVLKTITT
jgi:hypothetical protein